MIDNRELLQECIDHGVIRLARPETLQRTPPPLPPDFDFQKVEGMLIGLAIGDALGTPTEGMTPARRQSLYGEIRDFLPSGHPMGPVGSGTDDTQLSFWTIEQLLEDGGLVPARLGQRFCAEPIVGIGNAVSQFVRRFRDQKLPWQLSGTDSLGNGALMRIAPVLIPYLQSPHDSMYADAALNTMLTHNAFGNIAACVAFVDLLWRLLAMRDSPEPAWWIDTFCSYAEDIEGDETRYKVTRREASPYEGPLASYTSQVCRAAYEERRPALDACEAWGSGAYLMETLPSVLYILAMHGHDPETAIVRAVNDTKDNDTIAAIVGCAVGALHGLAGLPERWVRNLSGRIHAGGDAEVFRLVFRTKQVFWLKHRPR